MDGDPPLESAVDQLGRRPQAIVAASFSEEQLRGQSDIFHHGPVPARHIVPSLADWTMFGQEMRAVKRIDRLGESHDLGCLSAVIMLEEQSVIGGENLSDPIGLWSESEAGQPISEAWQMVAIRSDFPSLFA